MDKKEILNAIDIDFVGLSNQMGKAVAMNNEYRKQQDAINKQSVVYNPSEIESQLANLKGKAVLASKPLANEIRVTLDKLNKDLAQLHKTDATDPALIGTLNIIRETKKVSSEMARQLNEPFKRDQGALQVLKGAYESHGQTDALVETNAMIYDPAKEMAETLAIAGSFGNNPEYAVNMLSTKLAKIAAMEGQKNWNPIPDTNGMSFGDAIVENLNTQAQTLNNQPEAKQIAFP